LIKIRPTALPSSLTVAAVSLILGDYREAGPQDREAEGGGPHQAEVDADDRRHPRGRGVDAALRWAPTVTLDLSYGGTDQKVDWARQSDARDTMSSSALSVVTHCFTYYYPVLVVNFHKVRITQSWIWIGSIHGLGWVEIRLMRSFGANWWYERLHVYCRGLQYTSCV